MKQQRCEVSYYLPLSLSSKRGLDSTLSIFNYVSILSDMVRLFIGMIFHLAETRLPSRLYKSSKGIFGQAHTYDMLRRASHRCATNAAFYITAHTGRRPTSFKPWNSSGSRNLLMETSSARPFLLLVLSTKSRASACALEGSRGRRVTSLSSGSPGTMDQRSKTRDKET